MRLPSSPTEFLGLVKKAGVSADKYLETISVQEQWENDQAFERRSNPETKVAIRGYLESLDGELTPELSRREICEKAGVPHNQGNSSFARHEVKRLMDLREKR